MSCLSKVTKPTDDKFNSLSFLTKLTKSLLYSREKSKICAVFVTFVVFDRLSVANFPSGVTGIPISGNGYQQSSDQDDGCGDGHGD